MIEGLRPEKRVSEVELEVEASSGKERMVGEPWDEQEAAMESKDAP